MLIQAKFGSLPKSLSNRQSLILLSHFNQPNKLAYNKLSVKHATWNIIIFVASVVQVLSAHEISGWLEKKFWRICQKPILSAVCQTTSPTRHQMEDFFDSLREVWKLTLR